MAKSQGEPRYQVPRALADSLAFRTLPSASKLLWHDMMMSYRGKNNGDINATLHDLGRYGWNSTSTLAKALAYLIAHGFMKETRSGGWNGSTLRQPCLYAFTHLAVNQNDERGIKSGPPTHDYRMFDPSNLPNEITLTSVKGLTGKNSCFGKRSVTLRNMKHDASNIEANSIPTLRISKHEKSPKTAKSRASAGIEANP